MGVSELEDGVKLTLGARSWSLVFEEQNLAMASAG